MKWYEYPLIVAAVGLAILVWGILMGLVWRVAAYVAGR